MKNFKTQNFRKYFCQEIVIGQGYQIWITWQIWALSIKGLWNSFGEAGESGKKGDLELVWICGYVDLKNNSELLNSGELCLELLVFSKTSDTRKIWKRTLGDLENNLRTLRKFWREILKLKSELEKWIKAELLELSKPLIEFLKNLNS